MANLTTEFVAKSNVPEVVEGDVKALSKRAEATRRTQEYIAQIIARGDPLKELEVQRDREIRLLEQRTAKERTLRELAEKAKAKIIADYAARRQAILDQAAEAERKAAERAAAEQRKAEEQARAAAERAAAEQRAIEERARAEAERAAAQAAAQRAAAVERAQAQVAAIIERGSPAIAYRRQAQRELAELRASLQQQLITQEQFEKARAAVIQRYAQQRTSLTTAAAAGPQPTSGDVYKQLTWVGERMEGVRSVMASLGAATNGVVSDLTLFSMQMVKGAGKATLFGFAAAGAAAGVAHIVQEIEKTKAADAQLEAMNQRWKVTAEEVERVRRAFGGYGAELDRGAVQSVIAAGREAGFTTAQIALMGDEIQRAAQLTGVDFANAARAVFSETKDLVRQAIEELQEYNTQTLRAGQNAQLALAAGGLRASAEQRAQAQEELRAVEERLRRARMEEQRLEGLLGTLGGGKEDVSARQMIVSQIRAQRDAIAQLTAQQEELNTRLREGAEAEARLREERDKAELNQRLAHAQARFEQLRRDRESRQKRDANAAHTGPVFGARIAEERAQADADERLLEEAGDEAARQAAQLAREAREALAAELAAGDPFAALNIQLERDLAAIAAKVEEARRLLDDPASAADAQAAIEALQQQEEAVRENYLLAVADAETKRTAEYVKRTNAEIRKATRDAELDRKAEEEAALAGIAAANSFAAGFRRFLDSKDPRDLFGGLLQAATGILGLFNPVAGGIAGLIGGFFRKGGVPFAYHTAQGRNGLATLPGLNYDAKPAWLHEEEVVMPKAVVRNTFGGLPEAVRVAAGGPLPRSSGAPVVIHNHWRALTPRDSLEVVQQQLAPVVPILRETRQSALMFDAYNQAPPRSR